MKNEKFYIKYGEALSLDCFDKKEEAEEYVREFGSDATIIKMLDSEFEDLYFSYLLNKINKQQDTEHHIAKFDSLGEFIDDIIENDSIDLEDLCIEIKESMLKDEKNIFDFFQTEAGSVYAYSHNSWGDQLYTSDIKDLHDFIQYISIINLKNSF